MNQYKKEPPDTDYIELSTEKNNQNLDLEIDYYPELNETKENCIDIIKNIFSCLFIKKDNG